MKTRLLDLLICPHCASVFELEEVEREGAEVLTGMLTCAGGHVFPVIGGVPRMFGENELFSLLGDTYVEFLRQTAGSEKHLERLVDSRTRTSECWGLLNEWAEKETIDYRWGQEYWLDEYFPLTHDDFRGKTLLEPGVGSGRNTYHYADLCKEVIGVDIGTEFLAAAWRLHGRKPNVHFVHCDLNHTPIRPGVVDMIASSGVLHHIPDPKKGTGALVDLLADGGRIAFWVYSHENNLHMPYFVEPLKKYVIRHIPFRVTLALSFVPAAIAYPIFRWVYGPVHDWPALGFLRKILPKSELFYHWGRSRFRWIWATVYDFSNAPIAHYLKRPELEQWAQEWGLKDLNITWRHRSTWRFQAIK